MHITLVGLWVLCPLHNCMDSKPILLGLWILCPTKFCGFCILELCLYGFHAYHTWCFVGSVSVTYNFMGLMPITLVSLWVLCFGVILPFCGFCVFCTYHFVGSMPLSILCYFRPCPLVGCNLSHICLWLSSFLFGFIRDVGITSDSYYSHGILI